MRAYKYTGTDPSGEVFPNMVRESSRELVDGEGNVTGTVPVYETLHAMPGGVFTLDRDVDHPRLEAGGRATKDTPAYAVRVDEPEPAAEAEPAAEPVTTAEETD